MPKRKPINLLEVQKVYDEIQKDVYPSVRPIKGTRCPKKCLGRIKNKGHCTMENCTLLEKEPVALTAVKIASGKKKRVPKLSRKDKRLLTMISADFKYRTKERPMIRKQLKESKGIEMPRLSPKANCKKIRLTWPEIFREHERITGKHLKEEIRKYWKKLGKPFAIKTIHHAAKRLQQKTTFPFYYSPSQRVAGGRKA